RSAGRRAGRSPGRAVPVRAGRAAGRDRVRAGGRGSSWLLWAGEQYPHNDADRSVCRPGGRPNVIGPTIGADPAVPLASRAAAPEGRGMKAISYAEYGGPEVLTYGEVDEPRVGPDSVLVRVRAAAVNPVDWKCREGYLDPVLQPVFPVVPGWDVSGEVVRTGGAVPEFEPGDEVSGYVREGFLPRGTFAEYVPAPSPASRATSPSRRPPASPWPGSPPTRCCSTSWGSDAARPSWCTPRPAASVRWPCRSPSTSAPASSVRRANATTTSSAPSAGS